MAGLHFDITGNNTDFLRKLEETRQGVSQTSKRIESEGGSIEAYFSKLAKGAAALGLGFSATQLIKDIVEVRGQFQQLEIAFETMLKSKEKASALMAQLTETAAKTPFDLQSVAQGAKQLLAYGTASEEVNDTLVRLGNIASGLSIPLGDLVYLYGTTQTQGRLFTQDVRQFMGRGVPLVKELAAELGKTEQQINEMVTAGKIGFPEVEKVIRNMTSENGQFYNLMEKQSQSLTGQISNLGDAWDGMLNKIGTQTQGVASAGISAVTSLIENYEEVGVVLASLVVSYGTYKAAIIVVNMLEKANVMIMRQAIIEKKLAAAANITLSNSMAVAAARGKMFALVQRNIISSLKGIGSTLANPYVLLGAAVGAATYGLYKFYTRETEVERMQRQYNDTKESAVRRESEHKAKVDELISSLEDETTAQMERVGAIEALKQLYPGIIEKYIDEEGHLKNLIALNKELAEFQVTKKVEQNKTDLHSYDERIKNQEEYINRMRTNDQSAFDDEVAKLDELKRQRELSRANVAADYINKSIDGSKSMSDDELKNAINAYQKALSENKNGEWFDTEQEFKVEDINRYISALKNLQTARTTAVHDKEYWENLKKETQSQLDALSGIEAAGKKGAALKDKIAGYEKEINAFSSNTTKQENQAEKLRKDQEKYKLLMDKQARDQKRMELESSNELKQIEINGLVEGSEKVLRQRKLNHKKELEEIKREAEDKKLEEIARARAAHESNPENKEKPFDAEKFVKSEPAKKQFASFDKVAEEKTKTTETKYNRGDDLAGLLSEYQDYTDKRLAIETKFNNDIATLEDQRKLALKNGDTKQVEEIDRAKAQATKNKGMELMSMDYDKLKESPEYVRAFENLKQTSSETLNSLLSQLENAKTTAAKVLSPDQLREYTTTIQSIMDELDSRNPFQALADRKKELAEAEEELAEAKRNLDTVNSGGKVASGTKLNEKTGKIDTTYLSSTQALEKYNKAKDKSVKADAKVKKAEKEVTDVVGELSKSIKEVGDAIGGSAGEIISLIGDIGLFAMTAMSGVSTASTTASKSIQAVEKASVILAIIGAAIQIAMKIASLFKDDDGVAAYEKAKGVYESYIDILDRVIEKQKELFELNSKTGEQAYEKAKETVKKQENASRELGKQYLNSGASKGFLGIGSSASEGVKQRDDMSSNALDEAKKVLGRDYNKATDGRMTGLFDMSAKQLADLQRDAPLFWAELHDDTQKYLQQIIDCNEELTKLEQDRMEGLVKTDFSSFSDSFLDMLTDLDSSSQDFADNFEKYLQNAILTSLITDKYKSNIEALYKQWADDTESGNKLTEDEAIALRKKQEELANSMLEERNQLMKDFGWTSGESSSQDSTKGGFATASQDSISELNGRFTAFQISSEEIKNQMITLNQVAASLLGINQTGFNELVNLRIQANSYLEDIAGFQKKMLGLLTDIDSRITRGIKVV